MDIGLRSFAVECEGQQIPLHSRPDHVPCERSEEEYRVLPDVLKMSLVRVSKMSDFTNYLAQVPPGEEFPDPESDEAPDFVRNMFPQVLELTHNHGTEDDPDFSYHNGNLEDKEKGILQGFGHTGFIVDDLGEAVAFLDEKKVPFRKRPEEEACEIAALTLMGIQ